MVVSFKDEPPTGNYSDQVTITSVTSTDESSGEKESRSTDRTFFEKADDFVQRNEHWFSVVSTGAIVGVEGYWLIRKVTG